MRNAVLDLHKLVALAVAFGGCTGIIVPAGGSSSDPGPDGDPSGAGPSASPGGPCRVAFPMRRLTEQQYENAVRDLFKGQVAASAAFPAGELGSSRTGFSTEPGVNLVTALGAEKVLDAADDVALAVADKLPALLPCAASGGDACAGSFIDDVGRRAYRRPLTADERSGLLALFHKASGPDAFKDGIALVVDTILQAAPFLYIIERGKPVSGQAAVVELTGYEIAARLSFLLWDSLPDAALLDAAARGTLATGKDIRAQAERMLADAKARATIVRFGREWTRLHVWKAGDKASRDFTDPLAQAMQTEFDLFMQNAFLQQGGTMATLLSSPATQANTALATFYGVGAPAGATATQFKPLTLDASSRAGLLTLPAFLSSTSHDNEPSYVQRGVFVLKNLLCQDLPAPPPDAAERQPSFPSGATQRQKSAAIRAVAECGACHTQIDQIGLGFDGYDEIGRARTTLPGGGAVDPTGTITGGPAEVEGPFHGVVELATRLAGSRAVQSCLARQWLRFAVSRLDGGGDACAVSHLDTAMSGSGQSLREMVLALTGSEEFRFRRLGGAP
jgi:hypothetical protein